MGNFQKEMERLEAQLTGLKKEFVVLASDQKRLSKHVDSLPGQIKEMREDVSSFYFIYHLFNTFPPAQADLHGFSSLHFKSCNKPVIPVQGLPVTFIAKPFLESFYL